MIPDHDIHIHTYLSACCHHKFQRPQEIVQLAEQMDLKTIGFADHVWMNPDVEPSDWYRPQNKLQISRLRDELKDVKTDLNVLVGCEADLIAPGKCSITPAFAELLDFVLLAASHIHMKDLVAQPADGSPRALGTHLLKMFAAGVQTGLATSIAHPLLPVGRLHQFDQALAALSDSELTEAFEQAGKSNVSLEITVSFLPDEHSPEFSIETPIRLLTLARDAGCTFTLGSDAHDPVRQQKLPDLSDLMHKCGITPEKLWINARQRT